MDLMPLDAMRVLQNSLCVFLVLDARHAVCVISCSNYEISLKNYCT